MRVEKKKVAYGNWNGDKIENENHSTRHERSPEKFPTGAIFPRF
jgi:hypothetical protein